jgi:hypothetical protein
MVPPRRRASWGRSLPSKKQIRQIAKSISVFGFNVPVLVDAELNVIAGHGRLLASLSSDVSEIARRHRIFLVCRSHQRNLYPTPLSIGHDGSRFDTPLTRLRRVADRRGHAPPAAEDTSRTLHRDDPHGDRRGPKSAHRARDNRGRRHGRLIRGSFDCDPVLAGEHARGQRQEQ